MALYYYEQIGEMTIDQDGHKFKVQIRRANCLAAFIHVSKDKENKGKYLHTLYMFLADNQHARNIVKEYGTLFGDKVVNIKLNLFYKESEKLLKLLTKYGYKVTCYYKEK